MLLDKKKVGIVTKVGAVFVALVFIASYIPILLSPGSSSSSNPTNQVGQTIAALEQAVQKSPKSANAWVTLGNAYYDANQWAQAAGAYEKALAIDPKNIQARVDMSIAYFGMGQIETATVQAQEATKLNPNFAPAYYNLGVFLSSQGKLEEAVQAYEAYIKLDKSGDKKKEAQAQIDVLKKQISKAPLDLSKVGGTTPTTAATGATTPDTKNDDISLEGKP